MVAIFEISLNDGTASVTNCKNSISTLSFLIHRCNDLCLLKCLSCHKVSWTKVSGQYELLYIFYLLSKLFLSSIISLIILYLVNVVIPLSALIVDHNHTISTCHQMHMVHNSDFLTI